MIRHEWRTSTPWHYIHAEGWSQLLPIPPGCDRIHLVDSETGHAWTVEVAEGEAIVSIIRPTNTPLRYLWELSAQAVLQEAIEDTEAAAFVGAHE